MTAEPVPQGLVCLTASEPPAEPAHGSELLVSELAAWLHRSGWPVELVAARRRPGRPVLDDVPVDLLEHWGERQWPQGLDTASAAVTGLAFRLRRLDPWLVHAFLPADALAARLAEHPYVLSVGGLIRPESFTGFPLLWRLFQLACEGARRVVCPSQSAADHLRGMYGLVAEVVPNGVDVGALATVTASRQPNLVFCPLAGDDDGEAARLVVDALAELDGGVELVVAGSVPGDAQRALAAALSEAGRERLRFVGPVDRSRRVAWSARAAVTCHPVPQGFPQAVVESLAVGTPAVGVDRGSAPEVLSAEVGGLFAYGDPGGCAEALRRVLGRAGDDDLAAACRHRARCYDWAAVGPRLLDLYRRAR